MEARERLKQVIVEHKDRILEHWEREVRESPIASDLPRPQVIDSIPELLDHLAAAAELGQDPDRRQTRETATNHAYQRLELGYEVGQLVAEYVALREALFDEVSSVVEGLPMDAWWAVSSVLDEVVSDVMERFSRTRTLQVRALERLSSEAFSARDVDTLLASLLDVLAEALPEVDSLSVLLREDGALRLHASRGLEPESRRALAQAVGDGFAGKIASTRKPLLVEDAAHDTRPESEALRRLGVRALYGVPLMYGDDVIGVAHMGSTRAHQFPKEDLILFRGLVERAASVIAGRAAADRLIETERRRDRFIAMLAHDLRSPLQAVGGSVQLLLSKGRLGEEERHGVERIARAAARMERLVSDVLDFTHLQLGEAIPLELSWVDLTALCRAVCEEAEAGHPGREVRVSSTMISPVRCDPDRIAQVVSNLVDNALRHAAPGTPVEVTLDEIDDDAVLRLHNEGEPIDPRLLAHIFEPFRRGDGAGPGLGLGLHVARAIVLAHRGSIEVQSAEGRGTTFIVRLPKQQG